MKLKVLLKIIESLFGMQDTGEEPRADMYMPPRLLAMALLFLVGGIGCGVYAAIKFALWAVICAVVGVGFGIVALLCWKNQAIHIISDSRFTYTTMFGNTYTYRFSDIQGLRRNQDSMTLFVAGKKVHIESMAILTPRLVEKINQALEKAYQ